MGVRRRTEEQLGSGRTLGIYALLAVGSITAEQALFHGAVGLSGVVYGLFGLLWVLGRSDPRFLGTIDRQTAQLLVGWFFLCIVLTVTNVMGVANVAHGAGFVLGALLGCTMAARSIPKRLRNAAILAVVLLLCIAGGTVARPYVNLTDDVGHELAYMGYKALDGGDPKKAADLYERAVAVDANVSDWWINLGIAYERLGRTEDAIGAFTHAAALKPQDADMQRHVRWLKLRQLTEPQPAVEPSDGSVAFTRCAFHVKRAIHGGW